MASWRSRHWQPWGREIWHCSLEMLLRHLKQQAQMAPGNTNKCTITSTRSYPPPIIFAFQTRVRLSLLTHLGLADELLKISEQLNYWAMRRCKTPLATSRAQKCKSAGPGSGGGARIWHRTASLAPPVHSHSSLLFGSDDSLKLSLDLHRYPSSGQKGKLWNHYSSHFRWPGSRYAMHKL